MNYCLLPSLNPGPLGFIEKTRVFFLRNVEKERRLQSSMGNRQDTEVQKIYAVSDLHVDVKKNWE